jgi:putative ABC transport system permease protein
MTVRTPRLEPADVWRSAWSVVRSFTRARGFTTAAILTVALGIGVNTVVFSMFDRVLFRPLPYSDPDRLVEVYSRFSSLEGTHPTLPVAVVQTLARETGLASGVAWAFGGDPEPLAPVPGENPLLWFSRVTTNTLDVLGVRPIIGPGFSAVRATEIERPLLLTYDTWQRRFNGSTDVLALMWTTKDRTGRDIRWRVVGVLPDGFLLPSPRPVTAHYDGIYGIDPDFRPSAGAVAEASYTLGHVQVAPFVRLAPGVSHRAAQSRIRTVVSTRFPRAGYQAARAVTVVPLQSGLSIVARPYVWLAVVGAWVVFGATCLTLGLLLLTWSQSRRQDAAVRLALGASPRRLVVTALAECTVLCGTGAAVGWLGYTWVQSLFVSAMPPGLRSFAADTSDVRVMLATCGIALASAMVAGTLPAIRTSRASPLAVFRSQHASMTFDKLVGGPVLLAVQAAFGVILLVGAAAVVPAVVQALLKAPGFQANDLFVFHLSTANDDTAENAREQTRRGQSAVDAVRRFPGVLDAALSQTNPLSPDRLGNRLPEYPRGFRGRVFAVDSGFFRTLATPMIAGRMFSEDEVNQQALVGVVNQRGAREHWPGLTDAAVIGRTVTTHDGPRLVVGVAADIRIGMDATPDAGLFLPLSANEAYRQPGNPFPYNAYDLWLRMAPGRIPERALLSDRLRALPWKGPTWGGVSGIFLRPVAADLDHEVETPRLLALIFGTLAGVTLLLTTIAVYGLASFEIRRRRYEMTVRLAMGATPHALRRRLAFVLAIPVLVGVLGGLPFGWVGAMLLRLSVPLVNPHDLTIYGAAAGTFLVTALLAAWIPGWRSLTMRTAELLRSS